MMSSLSYVVSDDRSVINNFLNPIDSNRKLGIVVNRWILEPECLRATVVWSVTNGVTLGKIFNNSSVPQFPYL